MEERQLEIKFKEFLLTKGYNNGNLLFQVALPTISGGVFYPDLVILDVVNKEYVALVEFKIKLTEHDKVNVLGQFYKYYSLIGTQSIPAYVVFPLGEEDFQILTLTKENTFQPIDKDDFPSLETLSAKQIIEAKLKETAFEEFLVKERVFTIKKTETTSYLMILSVVIGLATAALFAYQQSSNWQSVTGLDKTDSLIKLYKKINDLKLNTIPKVRITKIDTVHSSSKVNNIEKRLKVFEDAISSNPDKILPALELKQQIQELKSVNALNKELMQEKLNSLNSRLELLNGWLIALLVTILGVVLSFAITNIFSKRKSQGVTDNQQFL